MSGGVNDSLRIIKKDMSFKKLLAYTVAFPDMIIILTEIVRIIVCEAMGKRNLGLIKKFI